MNSIAEILYRRSEPYARPGGRHKFRNVYERHGIFDDNGRELFSDLLDPVGGLLARAVLKAEIDQLTDDDIMNGNRKDGWWDRRGVSLHPVSLSVALEWHNE